MKRKLSLFLILILAVQLVMAVPSFAADNVYTVNTAEDFIAFFGKDGAKASLINQGYYVKLNADIDLGTDYEPNTTSFIGTFDGQGHKIKYDITVKRSCCGLIGNLLNATVKNVIVNGDLSNSSNNSRIGGITGEATNSVIENCEVNVYINATAGNDIGGIAGYVIGADSRISSCVFNGNEKGGMYAHYGTGGGIVARGQGTIENCVNNANISSTNWYIAGITGYCFENTTIKDCRNFGNITGESSDYGFKIGGIAGEVHSGTINIERCYNNGNITANSFYAGSIVGSVGTNNVAINISDCYNTGVITAKNSSAGSAIGGSTSAVGNLTSNSKEKDDCAKDLNYIYNIKNYYDTKNSNLNPVAYKCETSENTENGVYIVGASNSYGITEAAIKASLPEGFSVDIWEIKSDSEYKFPQLKSIGVKPEIKYEYLAGNKMSGTVTAGSVIFTEEYGNLTASVYITDIKKTTTKLALFLIEETDGNVTSSMVDIKDVACGREYNFTASLPIKEGSSYKAYVWNYSSLTPYTKTANYLSSNNTLKELNFGESKLDTSEKEITLNSITKHQIPIVTAVPLDSGTKVKVSVEGKTMDGKVVITVTSQDNSQQETITINFAEISDELKAWLSNSGIDVEMDITTYYIEENDIQ